MGANLNVELIIGVMKLISKSSSVCIDVFGCQLVL